MSNKIEPLLHTFQNNVYPGMTLSLARALGVSVDSITRLALGWAPIVQFKKKVNFQGWWTIAERNEFGVPVGLSLRSTTGMKVMYPGSKHGLCYEVNPDHESQADSYFHGSHNWSRTMDAGVLCPVCSKPDGCLVSAENPDDPQAAICIRTSEGSEKPMKFGYLHVLKEAGRFKKDAGLLRPSEDPVLIVEGMTDTAAAMDLGFVAVGRPSNLAGLNELAALCRGRDCYVLGENDRKPDGKEPGRDGMIAAFQNLKRTARVLKMAMPPSDIKDLRNWYLRGLTREELLAYFVEKGQERSDATVLQDDQPYTLAKTFLDAEYRMVGRYTLKQHCAVWYAYDGTKYSEIDEERVRGPMYDWSRDKVVMDSNAKGESVVKPLTFTKGIVTNMMDAMLAPSLCLTPNLASPMWINGVAGPDPGDLIAFENGLLWVSKYLDGADESEYLLPHSPDFFTLFALPFSFDPTAQCPKFKKFLLSSLGDEEDKIKLIREWIGLCMTPTTKYQKMLIMRGPPASGKSTLGNLIADLVGERQSAQPRFSDLMEQYGLEGLVGAQVAVIGDARLPRKGDAMQALETVLKITGEDKFNIPRKFKKPLRGYKFATKITVTTNELPELPDHSQAMSRRLLILDFKKSFVGHEDHDLGEKLKTEFSGIATWALTGLKRLRDQAGFTIPTSMAEAMGEWRTATSPIAAFIEECCDIVDGVSGKNELYDAWTAWAGERGMRSMTRTKFLERLRANAPVVRETTEMGGHKQSLVRGIALKKWAQKKLLGRPNG